MKELWELVGNGWSYRQECSAPFIWLVVELVLVPACTAMHSAIQSLQCNHKTDFSRTLAQHWWTFFLAPTLTNRGLCENWPQEDWPYWQLNHGCSITISVTISNLGKFVQVCISLVLPADSRRKLVVMPWTSPVLQHASWVYRHHRLKYRVELQLYHIICYHLQSIMSNIACWVYVIKLHFEKLQYQKCASHRIHHH